MNERVRRNLLEHARQEAPREACGLLVEEEGWLDVWRATNVAETDHEFLIDPREQFQMLRRIEREDGLRLAGIYHSHPRGPATLSDTDRALAFYPVPLIVVCLEPEAVCWYEP